MTMIYGPINRSLCFVLPKLSKALAPVFHAIKKMFKKGSSWWKCIEFPQCFQSWPFKALWLAYGGTLADKGKYIGIPGARDHDLCSLEGEVAERVDTGLNSKER